MRPYAGETLTPVPHSRFNCAQSHYNDFSINNQWGKSCGVCVASSGVGLINPAPLLLSQRKSLWGPGIEVPPPAVSNVENNLAVLVMAKGEEIMKIKKSILTLALLAVIAASFTAGAAASGTLKEIAAYLNYGITIKYDGETQNLTDAAGNRVYPITYNGTTYLPVRAVSNMLGVAVDWDGATQTVLLGKTGATVNLMETYKPYTSYQSVSRVISDWHDGPIFYQKSTTPENIGGETASSWLNLYNPKNNWAEDSNTLLCSFNIGGKYKTLTFKAYTNEDTTLTVKGDNDSLLGEFKLTAGQTPQTFTVDLLNTTQLTFLLNNGVETYGIDIETYVFDAKLEA